MNIVAHNLCALNAQRQFGITSNKKTKSLEKLSSGYKINRSADDAAGLSISEKMRRQIRGLTKGVENAQDGVSLCQVADGALAEVQDMLHRITELSVQSANGTNTEQDRQYIQQEISQLLTEIDRIGDTTTFNEKKLFNIAQNNSTTATNQVENLQIGDWIIDVPIKEQTITYTQSNGNYTHTVNGTVYTYGDVITVSGLTLDEEGFLSNYNQEAHWMQFDGLMTDVPKNDTSNYDTSDALAKWRANLNYNDLTLADLKVDDEGYVYFESNVNNSGKKYYLATTTTPYNNADWNGATLLSNQISKTSASGDTQYIIAKKQVFDNVSNTDTNNKNSKKWWIHSGCEAGDGIFVEIDSMNTSILGIKKLDVSTTSGAEDAMNAVKGALQKVTQNRSRIGAQQNRLEHTIANEENIVENTTAAEALIRDTNMATEMVRFSNLNILEQAGFSMMAQANQSNQGVLALLNG